MKAALRFGGIGVALVGAVLLIVGLTSGPPPQTGDVTHHMASKEQVISGVYKVYGVEECPVPMWLAKTVIKNGTNGRITNLQIRYKVTGYADGDWESWHKYPAMDPDQTVVDLYHPIFSSACAKLTSRTPADLHMEGQYVDANGETHAFDETRRLTMLNRQEFIFSDLTSEERTAAFQDFAANSPLLAAYVSQNDAPVARLASMANKKAGGLGASSSAENTIKVMAAIYDVMRAIHISYQHPQTMIDQNMSFDVKLVQSLQYPRETVEKRSGTCIDLAILYAALLNSVNIRPYLCMMDGHCFPIAGLPNGNLLPLEATMVGDGYEKAGSFEQAVKSASETWQKVNQNGRFVLVDVRTMWANGVNNPELDPLPPDVLETWGIVKLVEGGATGGGGTGGGPATAVAGDWSITVKSTTGLVIQGACQVTQNGNAVQLIATATYQTVLADGRAHRVQERNLFTGAVAGAQLQATCTNAQLWIDGVQMPAQGLPYRLTLAISQDGKTAQGQVANSMGGGATVAMQKQ